MEALIRAIETRGEHYGAGFEVDVHEWDVAPPEAGTGSAGLGDVLPDCDVLSAREAGVEAVNRAARIAVLAGGGAAIAIGADLSQSGHEVVCRSRSSAARSRQES